MIGSHRRLGVLRQTGLLVTAGADVLIVQDILDFEAEAQRILAVDIPVLADAGVERISRVELLLTAQVSDVLGRRAPYRP